MTTTPLPYSYHQGKNQNGTVYIFDNHTADDSGSEDEVYQMKTVRPRGKGGKTERSQEKPQDTITHELIPEDTLASLSLKYNCKVAELKRINHIWQGNEISARSSILVPVAAHSLLLEQAATAPSTATFRTPLKVDIRTISIKNLGEASDTLDTSVFLERMNADIETLLQATQAKTRHASLDAVKSALTVERIFPKHVSSSRGGESLALLLVGTFIVFLVIPGALVYLDLIRFKESI